MIEKSEQRTVLAAPLLPTQRKEREVTDSFGERVRLLPCEPILADIPRAIRGVCLADAVRLRVREPSGSNEDVA